MIPLRLSWAEIREKAEQFRKYYVNPTDKVPVPIIDIVEFDLGLEIIPKPRLKVTCDLEAFLSKNLTTIYIDQSLYMSSRYENRLRFTLAHEVGHLILHKKQILSAPFENEEEWIRFRTNINEEDNLWFERQAHEFSGRLLVPKSRLVKELEKNRDKVNQYRELTNQNDDDQLKVAISKVICGVFGVSSQVIYRRINSEKVWDVLKL